MLIIVKHLDTGKDIALISRVLILDLKYSDNGSSETDTGESAMEKLESVRVILDQKIDHITDYIDNELKREGNNLKVFIQILG